MNWGVHGYGLGSHFLAVRERAAGWNPDCVVLVLFLGNDLQDNFAPLASASVPRFEMADGELTFIPGPPVFAAVLAAGQGACPFRSCPAVLEVRRKDQPGHQPPSPGTPA